MAQLKKIVKLFNINGDLVQVCELKGERLYFVYELGTWQQCVPDNNTLEYAHPSDRPLVYFADRFLSDRSRLVTQLARMKKGVYEPI